MVKRVVRTVAFSSICSTLLVCLSWLQTEVYYRSPSLSATRTKRNCIHPLQEKRKHITVKFSTSGGPIQFSLGPRYEAIKSDKRGCNNFSHRVLQRRNLLIRE